MSSDLSILRLRTWVRSLTALVAERSHEESEIEQRHRTDTETCRREGAQASEQLESRHHTETRTAEADYRAEQTRTEAQFTSRQRQTRMARDVEREKILEKGQHSESTARRKLEEAIWAAETVYEAKEGHPEKQYHRRCKELKASLDALEATERQAQAVLKRGRQKPPAPTAFDVEDRQLAHLDAATALDGHAASARGRLDDLAGMGLLRLFPDIIPFLLALLPGAAVVAVVGLIRGWEPDTVMLSGAGGGLALGIGVMVWLYLVARARSRVVYGALAESLQRGRLAYADAREQAEEQREREKVELITTRDREVREAKEKYEPIIEEIIERREHHLVRIREKYPALLTEIQDRREQQARESRQRYEAARSSVKQDYEQSRRDLETRQAEQTQAIETRYAQEWAALQAKWTQGVDWARTEADAINAECTQLFPPWADPAWKDWTPRDTFAPAIRFGGLDLDMKALPGGLSADERLAVG
ncbi:MAG: coiled-coil domain-containing protein, partial [Planctomycetota bacterium]